MPNIKILYIITKLELGGAQKQLVSLLRHIDKEKYSLLLFTASDGLLLEEAMSIKGVQVQVSHFLERPINLFKDMLSLAEMYRFIKKNRIDIVHTHSSKAGLLGRIAARLARVQTIVHTVHGWSFNDFQSFAQRKLFISLERLCARFTHRFIVVCEHDRQKGLVNRIGTQEQYTLIRYGIKYEEFETKVPAIRRTLGIRDDDLAIGMVSCFKPQKSPLDFVRLAHLVRQSLPNATFVLVGDGVLRNSVRKLTHALGLDRRIILAGWRSDMPAVLSAIDVFVLTSLWEGLPIAVLEAMAASRPVIATDTGGIAELIVEGKTGFLVKPRDVKTMSEKVSLLLRDARMRDATARNAKRRLGDDFRLEHMIRRTQDLYSSVTGHGRA